MNEGHRVAQYGCGTCEEKACYQTRATLACCGSHLKKAKPVQDAARRRIPEYPYWLSRWHKGFPHSSQNLLPRGMLAPHSRQNLLPTALAGVGFIVVFTLFFLRLYKSIPTIGQATTKTRIVVCSVRRIGASAFAFSAELFAASKSPPWNDSQASFNLLLFNRIPRNTFEARPIPLSASSAFFASALLVSLILRLCGRVHSRTTPMSALIGVDSPVKTRLGPSSLNVWIIARQVKL